MTDLPKKDEPLCSSFQRRDKGAKEIECSLTENGQSTPLYTMVDRDKCQIDICPFYQAWKLDKEILRLLQEK
jgi:hypothetical protein